MKFNPHNENHLLSVGSDGLYKIWDLRAGEAVIQGQVCEEAVNCASWNKVNGHMFACAGEDCMVTVWDERMPDKNLNELRFHDQEVTSLDWHPTSE